MSTFHNDDNDLAQSHTPYFRNLDMQLAKSLRSTTTSIPRIMIIVYAWKGRCNNNTRIINDEIMRRLWQRTRDANKRRERERDRDKIHYTRIYMRKNMKLIAQAEQQPISMRMQQMSCYIFRCKI